jgi:hypothetical protein
MRIDFDRDLTGHTVVQTPDTESGDRNGMERIAVDPTLDEAYEIWTTQPDEARSLLSGQLRDGLLKLNDDVAASLSFAFKGRTVYAAANYHKELFEPRIAVAMKAEDLSKMAAPYVDAIDIVKALGLERRKSPADPSFHAAAEPPKGKGLDALAARMADGDLGIQDVIDAQAEDAESAPVVPPTNPYPQLTDTGPGLEVRYPVGVATLFAFLMTIVLTPLLGVSLVTFASASLGAQLRSDVARLWPQWAGFAEALLDHPTAFLLVTLFVWWMFAGSLAHRPSQVTIDPGGVSIRRLVWMGQTLPLDVVRHVQPSNRAIVFARSDKSLLRSFVIGSPNLKSGQEAAWLAAELRKALKRSGWRPAPKA